MKSIILLLLLSVSIFADSKITIVPYIGVGSYDSNNSDGDTLVGLYAIMKEDTHSIELSIESKNLDYVDGTKLKQINLASSYKTTSSNNVGLNALIHYISNNEQSDGTFITLLEAVKTYQSNIKLGLEVSYSIYNADTLTKNMLQLRPSLSFNYGHPASKWGTIHPKISFYYMKPMTERVTLENSYFSTEFGLTHAKGSFISSASIWFGEQLYAVRDGGFTIYNLNELYTSGFLISSRYRVDKDLGVKLSYSSQDYNTYDATTSAFASEAESINRILLIADFSF